MLGRRTRGEAVALTERLLTAREVAERLSLSPATVLDRFEAGDLPGFKLYGRRGGPVRFRWSEIEAALEGWRPVAVPGRGKRQLTTTGTADGPYASPLPSRVPTNQATDGGQKDEEDH
jgi:predicted DNA-binding transcriptional regulator AlpA